MLVRQFENSYITLMNDFPTFLRFTQKKYAEYLYLQYTIDINIYSNEMLESDSVVEKVIVRTLTLMTKCLIKRKQWGQQQQKNDTMYNHVNL